MICPNCGYKNREDARSCHRCGTALEAEKTLLQPVPQDSSGNAGTQPLNGASVAFDWLPEGALLHEGRYQVLELRTASEDENMYRVEETRPVRLCPNCRTPGADPEERFCAFCGAEIAGARPLYLRYLVRESRDLHAFTAEAQILGLRLEHPALLLPHDVFVEAPYGPPRAYLVESEFKPATADTLPVPQPLHTVLGWGIALAQGLDYLHRHQVTMGGVGLEQIALEGKTARWVNLRGASVISPEARARPGAFFARDVRGLAAALFYLATGQTRYSPPGGWPAGIAALFAQALGSEEGFSSASALTAALETALQAVRRPASVTLVTGQRTDVGQQRSLNEDSLLSLELTPIFCSVSQAMGVFVVADGMGGHDAGDVASRLTVQTIANLAVRQMLIPATAGDPLPSPADWLQSAVQAANRSVYERARAVGSDMGSTMVAAVLVGDAATIANVGDSRAYLLRRDGIAQITVDHSLVERLVATGQITREEAAHHPQRNVVYRVIGDRPQVEADLFEQRLDVGQALLLCSDGLSGMLSDEQMWSIWRAAASPQEACDRLVAAANDAGGEDNISVMIVQVA